MRLYYICDPIHTKALHSPWHALEIENGKVLVCVDWKDEGHERDWSAREGVEALPHPIFDSAKPIASKHAAHLKAQKGHTVHDVIKAAAKRDPWMRLQVL